MSVVFLHGAYGMASDFDEIRHALTARFSAHSTTSTPADVPAMLAFNIAGHGDVVAGPTSENVDELFEEAALNIVLALEGIADQVTLVGYSLGARLALAALLLHPERSRNVERLVLVSGTAGLSDEADRDQRLALDDERAAAFEADPAAFLADFWQLPLFADLHKRADLQALLQQRQARAQQYTALRARWMRGLSVARMPALWPLVSELRRDIDVDLVVGENDATYLQAAHHLQRLIARAKLHTVEGVRHAIPLLAPDAVVDVIEPRNHAWEQP